MKRFTHPWLRDSEWPLLQVVYAGGENYSLAEIEAMLADVEAFYAQNTQPFAWVVDARHVRIADARARRLTAEHEERTKDHKRQYNCGTAFVIDSAFVRGILTAVFWLAPPVYPNQVFATTDAARAWAREQLDKRATARSGAPPTPVRRGA